MIIDDHYKSSSSVVAAGILNPITGKRLVKSGDLEQVLPVAVSFYKDLEKGFGKQFFYEREVLRLLRNKNERKKYESRKEDGEYGPYLGEFFKAKSLEFAHDTFGAFIIKHAGNLDTREFLEVLRKYFEEKEAIREDVFNYEELDVQEDSVSYKEIAAKKVIFCEGYKVIENPYFKDLKWEPAKGEILSVKFKEELPDYIINKGKWILPSKDGAHRVGSTFQWDNFNNEPTESGKTEILEGIGQMLKNPECEVVDAQAGVRPATKDSQPYIGLHEEHPTIGLFNGFGAKGTLLAPYYASQFADFLENGVAMDEKVSLTRKI